MLNNAKWLFGATGLLLSSATLLNAAGLDRSGQNVSAIFDQSGSAGLSFGMVNPSVTGTDSAGTQYDVGESYTQTALTYTRALSEQTSLSFIMDQPFGANTFYNGDPTTGTLAGTGADLSSEAISIIGKYQITPRVSVFGGIKAESVRATVNLNGTAYASAISVSAVANAASVDSAVLGAALLGDPTAQAALGPAFPTLAGQVGAQVGQFNADNGYAFNMDTSTQVGWLVGAAYEIPEIAFRLAMTYHFETEHNASTTERVLGNDVAGRVDFVTPQAFNLDFQTGIAKDTLLTASFRWAEYSAVNVVAPGLGSDLVNLSDATRYTLGVARRFNDKLSGSITLSYEPTGDDLVSPLGPTNGLYGISIGGQYKHDNMTLSGGVNYSVLGDAEAEVAGVSRASFKDNSSLAVGFRAVFTF